MAGSPSAGRIEASDRTAHERARRDAPATAARRAAAGDPRGEPGRPDERLANLDLLRAAAILLVILYHCGNVWLDTAFGTLTRPGRQGVDLFFVLSGWLIGGLFWRERRAFGDVQVPRFMLRRLIRTAPPYYAALGTAWLGARWAAGRALPFDWHFLVFLQTYRFHDLPYFKPSWSLCVEEHFYLVLPLLLTSTAALRAWGPRAVLVGVCVVAPVWRIGFAQDLIPRFAQTQWWVEGLALGVLAANVRYLAPRRWPVVRRAARWMAGPAAAYFLLDQYLPGEFQVRYGLTLTAWSCACIVVALAEAPPITRSRLVYWLAVCSYSLYLVNTQAIAAERIISERFRLSTGADAALMPLLILGSGVAFYFLFEAPAIRLRDRLAPRRSPVRAPAAAERSAEEDPGI